MYFSRLQEMNSRRRAIALMVAQQVRYNEIAIAEAHRQIRQANGLLQKLRVARELERGTASKDEPA
jgi:hypothetical protein